MPEIATRYGQLAVPDPARDLIGRFLLRYGEWAQNEVRFVASALRPAAPRICDIGAFVGTFGLGLAQARPLGGLVFVEANPELLRLLERNAKLAPGVEPAVVGAAVGSGGTLGTPSLDPANIGSLSFAVPAGEGRVAAASGRRAVTLADLRRDFGPFDLVKIDAEGLEREILLSDPDGLRDAACSYWLECNESPESLAVCELLLAAGFRLQYFAFPSHSPSNFLGDPTPIFPFAYEAGLWATREQPAALDPALAAEGCLLVPITTTEDLRAALWRTPRFGRPEWVSQSAPVIAALAGHELRGETYGEFPAAEPPSFTPVPALRARIAELETRALAAEAAAEVLVADARERELVSEDLRRAAEVLIAELEARTQQIQAAAEVLVADARERELVSEDLRRAAEAELVVLRDRLPQAEARALAAEAMAAAIANSTTWRVTGALRARLAGRPRLVRAAKVILRPVWRTARALLGRGRE